MKVQLPSFIDFMLKLLINAVAFLTEVMVIFDYLIHPLVILLINNNHKIQLKNE